jgi:ADP-L-glycero-D-manno-heptose 6-epimerase
MRFLVTGAGGFVGANVALDLDANGHEVHALDHFSDQTRRYLKGFRGKLHHGDIRDFDYASLGKLDGVFHQAAITDTTVMDKSLMMAVNVEAFQKILDNAMKTGCPKVVYASSAATYGKGSVPMREDTPPTPANIYGESKAVMDKVGQEFAARHPGISIVGLRYFNVYGPLEFHKKAAASMIFQLYRQISTGKRPRIFKWGEQFRDFVYVKDVVSANMRAFEFRGSGYFNVGTGLKKTLNIDVETDYFDNPYDFYQSATQADTTKSEKILGFKAAYPPEKGIPDYVEYLQTDGHEFLANLS